MEKRTYYIKGLMVTFEVADEAEWEKEVLRNYSIYDSDEEFALGTFTLGQAEDRVEEAEHFITGDYIKNDLDDIVSNIGYYEYARAALKEFEAGVRKEHKELYEDQQLHIHDEDAWFDKWGLGHLVEGEWSLFDDWQRYVKSFGTDVGVQNE